MTKLTQYEITNLLVMTPSKTLKLTGTEKHILITLSVHFDSITHSCYPTQAQLSELSGSKADTVSKALAKCKELGYIGIKKNKHQNNQYLNNIYYWLGLEGKGFDYKKARKIKVAKEIHQSELDRIHNEEKPKVKFTRKAGKSNG